MKLRSEIKTPKHKDAKANIIWTLKAMKVPYVVEHEFVPDRKFRFDFAILHLKIAIEYEGLLAAKGTGRRDKNTGKSGHTTISGYSKDTIKYNLAIIYGWRVLRYTPLTFENLEPELRILMGTSTVSDFLHVDGVEA